MRAVERHLERRMVGGVADEGQRREQAAGIDDLRHERKHDGDVRCVLGRVVDGHGNDDVDPGSHGQLRQFHSLKSRV